MVVRQASLGPGEPLDADFEQVLLALAQQDHPRLKCLFLLVGPAGVDHGQLPDRIRSIVPSAFVRALDGNPGFGAAANEAARLVQGNGVFCFLHDDVALEPNVISVLAEEKPWWEPGRKHGYHVNTFGFLIGEIVRRVSGESVGAFFRREVAGPLDADFHFGIGPEHDERVSGGSAA